MKLLQFRLRSPSGNSGWLKPGPGLSVLSCANQEQRSQAAAALGSLNPLLPCCLTGPFTGTPHRLRQRGYWRQVDPGKYTPAIGIFAAEVSQIQELAHISPLLYEVERIEVGRRLDYSRWFNFVELPSSSRYGEVLELVPILGHDLRQPGELSLPELSAQSRIKGALAEQLTELFTRLQKKAGNNAEQPIWQELFAIINRARDFRQARTLLPRLLPLTIHCGLQLSNDPSAWFYRQERRLQRRASLGWSRRLATNRDALNTLFQEGSLAPADPPLGVRGASADIMEGLARAISLGVLCRGIPPLLVVEPAEAWWPQLEKRLGLLLKLSTLSQIILVTDEQKIPLPIREQATLLSPAWL